MSSSDNKRRNWSIFKALRGSNRLSRAVGRVAVATRVEIESFLRHTGVAADIAYMYIKITNCTKFV
jgi:hypothetical protein